MVARASPEDGDIVGVVQAVTFAERQRVRASLTDEGCDFVLLEDFRVVESV